MKIKAEIIEKIKGNLGLRNQLIELMGVTRGTIYNWLEDNDDNLTKAAPLKLIADHYNMTPDEILEDEKAVA